MVSSDFIKQHQPTVYTTRAMWYLHTFFEHQKWLSGLAYEADIRTCQLDYSIESLKRIDSLIDRIRSYHTPDEASFLSYDRNQNFLFLLAFYCGELVGRIRNQAPIWYSYPDFMTVFPKMKSKVPQTFSNYLIVCSLKDENHPKDTIWFPLTAIYERLFNPQTNKSVYATVVTLLADDSLDEQRCYIEDSITQSLGLNMAKEMAQFPKKSLGYLQIAPPEWLMTDPLYHQLDGLANMYNQGRVVWGAIIQPNTVLFEDSVECQVTEVVYDPAGRTDVETLQEVAKNLLKLKATQPTDEEEIAYLKLFNERPTRFIDVNVPKSISAAPLKVNSVFVWRPHLPNGRLTLDYFPILLGEHQEKRCVTILPAYFWRMTELYQVWISKDFYSSAELSLAFYQRINEMPNFWQSEFSTLLRPQAKELPNLGQHMTIPTNLPIPTVADNDYIDRFYQYLAHNCTIVRTDEQNILECVQYLQQGKDITGLYSAHIEQYARMRFYDFSGFLKELVDPDLNAKLGQHALLQVDKAIQYKKLKPEQIQQLLSALASGVKQGNTNTMLYLAYLYLVGLFVPQSLDQANEYMILAMNAGDWRTYSFKAEQMIANQEDPTLIIEQLELASKQGHPTAHTRLAQFALEVTQKSIKSPPVQDTSSVLETVNTEPVKTTAETKESQSKSAPLPQFHSNMNIDDMDEEQRMQLYEMLRENQAMWQDFKPKSKFDLSNNNVKIVVIVICILIILWFMIK